VRVNASDLIAGLPAPIAREVMRLFDRALPQHNIDDPVQTGAAFAATNNGVQYLVSPTELTITQGSTMLSNEPMLEYWSA
jgi:hypothetical protein